MFRLLAFFLKALWQIEMPVLNFAGWFVLGLGIWTITEYILHRYVFHFEPNVEWGKKIHFIFHGVHHDYPNDAKRLVMPPSASIPMALGFTFFSIGCCPKPRFIRFSPVL
jgi:4-hydroxysphinganine ceramide fatty acyl 2-hydroxylase